jgi:class 3 adenylate cyclase
MSVADTPVHSPSESRMMAASAALAAFLTVYGALRFGAVAGMRIALAGGVFVLLDAWAVGRRSPVGSAIVRLLQGAILAGVVLASAPLGFASELPAPFLIRTPFAILLICFVAANVSARDPVRVVFAGASAVLALVALGTTALYDPLTITVAHIPRKDFAQFRALLAAVNAPHYFSRSLWQNEIIETLVVTAILAVAAWRMRALARSSAAEEATREALAAYFSPRLADTIIGAHGLPPQEKMLAVLDADLVGFTALAERLTPEQAAAGLRAWRQTVEDAVFAGDGAISAFVGDGATAFFGLTAGDASERAVAAALRLATAWNGVGRDVFEGHDVRIAVGIDTGIATVGLVGEGRAMSLLFLGAPLVGAERLQRATRECGATILLSDRARDALGRAVLDGVVLTPVTIDGSPAWRADAKL